MYCDKRIVLTKVASPLAEFFVPMTKKKPPAQLVVANPENTHAAALSSEDVDDAEAVDAADADAAAALQALAMAQV